MRLSVISTVATYALTSNVVAVDEGSMVTITLTTTGVQMGQVIPFVISGTNITLADFTGLPALTGQFAVGVDGKAYIYLTANADLQQEGSETFRVTLVDTAHYVSVDINDTSAYQPFMVMYASGTLTADPILGGSETLPFISFGGYASGTLTADPILGGSETLPLMAMSYSPSGTLTNDPVLGGSELTTPLSMAMFA